MYLFALLHISLCLVIGTTLPVLIFMLLTYRWYNYDTTVVPDSFHWSLAEDKVLSRELQQSITHIESVDLNTITTPYQLV